MLPFDAATTPLVTGPAALNALLNAEQRAKLYAVSTYGVDVVLAGKYTGSSRQAANAIVQRLESVCVDPRVKAAWIGDGYVAALNAQTLARGTGLGDGQRDQAERHRRGQRGAGGHRA